MKLSKLLCKDCLRILVYKQMHEHHNANPDVNAAVSFNFNYF